MKLSLSKTVIITLTTGAAVIAFLFVQHLLPRYQLLSASYVTLGHLLEHFIQEHGRMPSGWHELESSGLLRATDYRGEAEWQVATDKLSPTILFYLEDLTVKWDVPVDSLVVREGKLVEVKTGRRFNVIESKRWYVGNINNVSVRIYSCLRDSHSPTSSTEP